MDRDDLWDQVPQILAPAIVFHGEVDAAFPMERAEQLARELPHCDELVRIPGAGHASNLSHAEAVNGPLHEFLSRHS
jgi:pimeloyl-ACP methyl ester carboxylesterase